MTNFNPAVHVENYYHIECYEHLHADGAPCLIDRSLDGSPAGCMRHHTPRLKWREDIENLVTTVGLNKLLDATFKTGLTTPAWYVGLVNNASFSAYSAADTAGSHAGWLEGVPYSNANRVTWTPGSVSGGSVDNSGSVAVFNINATLTVRGAFLIDNNTKSGTTGTLYGEGDFSASRAVLSGDTMNVTITLTAS